MSEPKAHHAASAKSVIFLFNSRLFGSPAGYTMWIAGGGVKGGQIIGATDELGYVPVERPVSPADMHATLLHAMGFDQHRLSWNHNNRDGIPTVFGGEVIKEVFA
ncbi:DUF1501 domain-containing protein [Stieleria neptunia]|uniref:DUF1501 domain-containing protein n=1 Tax=Stieleria neptunia TaxID=2527979 RepID=UPI001E3646DA|nr:DUF1501 domain-containing protein [Stieleria neptunia]